MHLDKKGIVAGDLSSENLPLSWSNSRGHCEWTKPQFGWPFFASLLVKVSWQKTKHYNYYVYLEARHEPCNFVTRKTKIMKKVPTISSSKVVVAIAQFFFCMYYIYESSKPKNKLAKSHDHETFDKFIVRFPFPTFTSFEKLLHCNHLK